MLMPTFIIYHIPRVIAEINKYGSEEYKEGAPIEFPVYAWSGPSEDELQLNNWRLKDSGKRSVYCPDASGVAQFDHLEFPDRPGLKWTVQGKPRDFNHGPFGFKPGWQILAELVSG